MKAKTVQPGTPENLETVVERFQKQDSEVGMEDFRDLVIRIPGNITAEVPEDKNGFLFDTNTGRVYALNRTASFLFGKIRQELSLSEILKQLTQRYDVNEAIAISDLQDFLYQLKELGVGSEE